MDGTALRSEIVESQKFIVDLEKWKFILVAGLGAAALGLGKAAAAGTPQGDPGLKVLLALIPLVCVYVDVLVYHNHLRILVISQFLQGGGHGDAFARSYERFCEEKRSAFFLEKNALIATTLFLSVAIHLLPFHIAMNAAIDTLVAVAGAIGIGGGTLGLLVYQWQVNRLESARGRKRVLRMLYPVLWLIVAVAVAWMAHPSGGPIPAPDR